jgi:hypothetical protein
MVFSETKDWMMADTKTPNNINGIASKMILRKMVLTLKKELGILVKIELFLISSAKRKRNTNVQNRRKMVQSLMILFIINTTNLPP